jgi:hypothetical protein
MELPPNQELEPFDAFYLDWDGDYNNEPYYKAFRDLDPREACAAAGFPRSNYLQFVVPSIGGLGARRFEHALSDDLAVGSQNTGRLAPGVRWFCFGAWRGAG